MMLEKDDLRSCDDKDWISAAREGKGRRGLCGDVDVVRGREGREVWVG